MIPLVNFLIKIKRLPRFSKILEPPKPKTVILLFKVTFFHLKISNLQSHPPLGVITGSFVKFTPVAKKRYATIGKTKVRKELYFFHYT
jgi:hypothetical protein